MGMYRFFYIKDDDTEVEIDEEEFINFFRSKPHKGHTAYKILSKLV